MSPSAARWRAYTGQELDGRGAARHRQGRRGAGDQGADRPAGLSARLVRRHRRRRAARRAAASACRSMSIPRELERRIVLCYTGEPRNSGTNNWDITKRHIDGDQHVFDCFERIRDTAAAMREALTRGDWDATAACLATEWENRKRLAPGVTTPAIDALIARATGRRREGREGLRRRRRRLPVLPRAARRRRRRARGAGRRRRARPRFPHRDHRPRRHARMTDRCRSRSTTSRSRARCSRSPTCSS